MTVNLSTLRLEEARLYLGTHARTRTPYGAAEFLDYCKQRERESYDNRLKIAIDCMNIYRHAFVEEYRRSASPPFSLQREHELYLLIHRKLFPLTIGEDFDLEAHIEHQPQFFLPVIPVRGLQRHNWIEDDLDFERIGPAFALAISFSHHLEGAWERMVQLYDLTDCPAPMPPLGAVGWTLFVYSCKVEDSPLRWLPCAFDMIVYGTGNPWLDLAPIGWVGMEWSLAEVMKLHIMKAAAEDQSLAVIATAGYIHEDPQPRIKRAVELWNDAATKEAQSGFHGMCIDEETREWHT